MERMPITMLPTIDVDTSLKEAAAQLFYTGDDALVVVDIEQKPIGILGQKEILHALIKGLKDQPVSQLMNREFFVLTENESLDPENFYHQDFYIVVDAAGKYQGVIFGTAVLKQRMQAAEERVRELYTAINNSYDGFCIGDGNGVMLETNSAFNQITGLSREDTIGKDGTYFEKNQVVIPSIVLQVLQKKGPVTAFQNYRTGKICMNSANPVFNNEGEIVRVITNVRDMTELNKLKEQLSEAEERMVGFVDELAQMRFAHYKQNEIVAKSEQMNKVLELAYRVSYADSTVLISGESGVGKEIIANIICLFSPQRSNGPFIKINCGALPENLLESELFGYEKGAFTGAKSEGKPGKFELANHGTIFLDEIGEMPLALQVKLLRVIQEKEVTRLGSIKPVALDNRIIAATNQDLQKLMAQGKFREDLYYRLNVVPIQVPPLRERKSDINPLALFFLQKYNTKYNRKCMLSNEILEILPRYDWPGNIRELENLVENLVVLSENQTLTAKDLPESFCSKNMLNYCTRNKTMDEILETVEKEVLEQAFQEHHLAKNVAQALGLSPATICRKAQKYGLG